MSIEDVIETSALFLRWNLLPQRDYRGRVEHALNIMKHTIGYKKEVSLIDAITDAMMSARDRIGFYPPVVIQYEEEK